jgi:hypothetical protein
LLVHGYDVLLIGLHQAEQSGEETLAARYARELRDYEQFYGVRHDLGEGSDRSDGE